MDNSTINHSQHRGSPVEQKTIQDEPSVDCSNRDLSVCCSSSSFGSKILQGNNVMMDDSSHASNDVDQTDCSSSRLCNDLLWPNVAESHKMRVLKNKAPVESFAEKLQGGIRWKSISPQNIKTIDPMKGLSEFENNPSSNRGTYECSQSKLEMKTKGEKDVNGPTLSQDSQRYNMENCQETELIQSDRIKPFQPGPKTTPPLLEKDFPDLSCALKVLSKCIVKDESDDGAEIHNAPMRRKNGSTVSKRKNVKKQPHTRDPISISIIDFFKESSEACHKGSSLSHRRALARDFERNLLHGNALDSSNPIRKRGKHREGPQKKRLSKLKQVILGERDKKKAQTDMLFQRLNKDNAVSTMHLGQKLPLEGICNELVSLQLQTSSYETPASTLKHTTVSNVEDILNDSGKKVTRLGCTNEHCGDPLKTSNSDNLCRSSSPKSSVPDVTDKNQLNKIPAELHSRKFRDYCDNIRCRELDDAVTNLLKEIYRFQDRFYQKDPIRAHAKRRFVLGIREVKKYLLLKKLKAIVIAPDLEPVKGPGGLDETVCEIREEGRIQKVPVIFAVGRRQMGFALKKKVPISIIGIINPEGAQDLFQLVLEKWNVAVTEYQVKAAKLCNNSTT